MNNNSSKLRVFLCHASQDKPIVRELNQRLLAEGWIDSWLDDENLLPGQNWNLEIEKAVESADAVIVCLSTKSITKEGYIQKELKYILDIALEKPEEKIFIIPLRLDDCQPPRQLRNWQYADFFPHNKKEIGYQKLLSSLKTLADKLSISFEEKDFIEKSSILISFMEYLEKNIARENSVVNVPSMDENLEMLSWRETLQDSINRFDEVDVLIAKETESAVYKKARDLFENRSYLESSIYWNELCRRHPSSEEYESYLKLCVAKIKRNQSIFISNSNKPERERAEQLMSALLSAKNVKAYGAAYNLAYYGYLNFHEPDSSDFFDYFLDMKQRYSEQLMSHLAFCKNRWQEVDEPQSIIDQAIISAKKLLVINPSEESERELRELQQIRELITQRE